MEYSGDFFEPYIRQVKDDIACKKLQYLQHEYEKKLGELLRTEHKQKDYYRIYGKKISQSLESHKKMLTEEYKKKAMETAQPHIDRVTFEKIAQEHAPEEDRKNVITISQSKLIELQQQHKAKEELKAEEKKETLEQEKERKVHELLNKMNKDKVKETDFEKKIQAQITESIQNPSVQMTEPEFLETLKEEKEAKVQELLAKMNKGREIDRDLTQEQKTEQKQEAKKELTNDLSLEEEKARKTKELLEQMAQNRELYKDKGLDR
ncbi:hypothetical protein A4D02_35450 [Niastella koreensis]|uniref:Uncharacterized protein n=2 Tax=Niastella koreensis TaxID=354356 RepID=G8TJG3_NIAKG|nr:hypothetical protein [Niastella koreensis]AEV99698.1 hypothetical protein Niako_3392 [Niastella koreensis GR20-10]OQP44275.1 hypothetical protein A4D02_35450 [Niastella koreensis]